MVFLPDAANVADAREFRDLPACSLLRLHSRHSFLVSTFVRDTSPQSLGAIPQSRETNPLFLDIFSNLLHVRVPPVDLCPQA